MCGSHLTSRLACRALQVMDQPLPEYKYWDVLNWSPAQVSNHLHGSCLGFPLENSPRGGAKKFTKIEEQIPQTKLCFYKHIVSFSTP